MSSMYINSFCRIKSNKINLNGEIVYQDEHNTFSEFIKTAYKSQKINYPKFYKMDDLSKLAFMAASIVLESDNVKEYQNQNIAIVFSNKASSLDTDRKHQNTIQNKSDYYPSPAIFVYTLPNICIGEICIRYKLNSENSFFIFAHFNAEHLYDYASALLEEKKAEKVLCGWVEFDENIYDAFVYLVSDNGLYQHNSKQIEILYNS